MPSLAECIIGPRRHTSSGCSYPKCSGEIHRDYRGYETARTFPLAFHPGASKKPAIPKGKLCMALTRTRILVTGGAGFLGSHLCERLLAEGNDVLCVDNYFTGRKENIAHLMGNPNFEA